MVLFMKGEKLSKPAWPCVKTLLNQWLATFFESWVQFQQPHPGLITATHTEWGSPCSKTLQCGRILLILQRITAKCWTSSY